MPVFFKTNKGTPEEQLNSLQKKKDWAGLAKAYYQMGVSAMEAGNLNQAQLWLHRADTIYSADDNIYDAVGEKLMDDCSERIGTLEGEEGLLYNAVPFEISQKAEDMSGFQVHIWGLMAISRLVNLANRLSKVPGCEVLGELSWAVDMMFNSLQRFPSQEEYQHLMDVCNGLYELNGKQGYWCGQIEVPGKAPFQVFDLNGMMGVEQEINSFLDSHLRLLAALSQGEEEDLPFADSDMIGCTLLPDYYVRTGAASLEEVPQIKAELQRIWNDYEFICSAFTWEEAAKKIILTYKQLDILE
ncbi:MAG: hypothetical protein HFE43_00415 [Oscillospiraceae bacterium]|jgi:hypothetical protein|nr:hypothetical protein [Oscillospiraceae bacterium]